MDLKVCRITPNYNTLTRNNQLISSHTDNAEIIWKNYIAGMWNIMIFNKNFKF